MSYKKCFISFLSVSIFFIMLIMVINYFVDPGNQFFNSNRVEKRITSNLLNNMAVKIKTNYNDRLMQKLMLQKITLPPKILVLGSSHTNPIRHEILKSSSFYNASVSAAYLEDDIALYYLFLQRGWQPKFVIICLDPWLINKKFTNLFSGEVLQLWKTNFSFEYYAAKKFLLGFNHINQSGLWYEKFSGLLDKYLQLLTIDYTKATIKHLFKINFLHDQATKYLFSVNTPCPSCYIRRPDGALSPSKEAELQSGKEVDLVSLRMVQRLSLFYRDIAPIEGDSQIMFERFLIYLTRQNIKVIFYFPPLEPVAYAELIEKNQNYRALKKAEDYFLALAKQHKLTIIGAYNPKKLGLDSADFVDSWHLKETGMRKIFQHAAVNFSD